MKEKIQDLKENLGEETGNTADQEDPLRLMAHNAGQPDRAEGSQENEIMVLLFGDILA